MTFCELSIIATSSATLAVVCVYFFLFLLYRQTYIGLWAVFWLVNCITQIIYHMPMYKNSALLSMGTQCIIIANHLLLVYATSKFFEKKMHPCWYYLGIVVTMLFSIATYFDWSLITKTLPLILFVASIYFWHGWLFIRYVDSNIWGKTVVGLSFIGMGVQTLNMPFLVTVSWLAPWGLLISAILRFIISIGTLMLFVEKNFCDLVIKENQYRLLAENAADTIYLYRLKPSYGIEYISPSIGKLTGYHPDEYYESPDLLFSLIHPSDSCLSESLVSNPAALASTPLILRLIRRDHAVIWVEQTTVPIINQRGICISFQGIIRDITSRKTLEQDIARLDRLNTVAQLAANVAHEIRNPLTTVRGYLQLFQKRPLFSNYREHFTLLIDELDRSNLIIKEYLSLCRNDPRDMQTRQLNAIIADLYPLIKATANGASMDVVFHPGNIPEIHLDGKEIRQLILNLIRNALEAMKPGGAVSISTYCQAEDIVLEIQDQGSGMPANILENIGQPFLTTKENGTGLGLAVVYRIANDHQAKVDIVSNDQGTTFYIIFKAR